jgi:hypothetical protein
MIRFDESKETYDSTNPRFGIEYSNIRIRSNKNAVHCPIAIRSSCRTLGILPVVHRNWDGFGLLAIISASTGKRSGFVVMMYIRLRRINKRNSSQCGSDNINIRTAVCCS